jgi:ATP-dependent helicase/nuclease subunit A
VIWLRWWHSIWRVMQRWPQSLVFALAVICQPCVAAVRPAMRCRARRARMTDTAARDDALDIRRNILLQAPAGSGKTTVLAQRFLAALAAVQEPEQVLAITFTRKAAAEMRERVLLALENALPATQADLQRWQELAAQVHAHARQCGWDLAELPARLRIQTIDSLAHEIARAMPLLGRVYSSLDVVDAAGPMYAEAAREALRYAEGECPQDLELLLDRLDNNRDRAEQLLAELLSWRNRWQQVLIDHRPEELAARVAASLQRITQQTLEEAQRLLGADFLAEAATLAATAARHRRNAGHAEGGSWAAWLKSDAALGAAPESLAAWQAVADLALTDKGEARKRVNVAQGFPPAEKTLKQRWESWNEAWQERSSALHALRTIKDLPPVEIDEVDRQALAALARLMLLAAMHLKLVFREHGMVDHSEVAAVARQALRGMGGPDEQSIRQTLRVHHLLVDEFQDTSPEQVDLVRDLIGGWDEGDARSLFLVGDPMQSIYLFRNSEVGLFLQIRSEGVGGVRLEARHLVRNFRSAPTLVEWATNTFGSVFPAVEDLRTSAISFLPSQAACAAVPTAGTMIWPQASADPEVEAAAIAAEIQALRAQAPQSSIAVLVQTRAVAAPVLRALAAAGIATRGVDLAMLADRSVVRDLVALGQALLNAGDRTAWLAVLRSPGCGILLADLKLLGDAAGPGPLVEVLTDASVVASLSVDGQARLARVGPLLLAAWQSRGSHDVASLVEKSWQALGGHAACQDVAELAAARQFMLALRQLQERQGRLSGAGLQALAAQLRDRSESSGDNAVEVLTIHHAKGLEWDAVFVPGLGKSGRADRAPLLRYLQLPAANADNDLLLAVHSIGESASNDPLSSYIKSLLAERQRNERVRLLYVAITRARLRLYLSGHAPWNEKEGAPVPASRSLLQLLWPAVRSEFAVLQAQPVETPGAPVSSLQVPWLRLPAEYRVAAAPSLPVVASLARAAGEAAVTPEFSWVGPLARAMGTVMHEEFERLATPAGAGDLDARLPFCAARLREQGIGQQLAQQSAAAIVGQLRVLAQEARVQWLVSVGHREAYSELKLSGVISGELRSVVIDRTFVDDGVRWIIDYKTSQHTGGGLAEFLDREMQRYAPQLRLYTTLAAQLGPEPVRAALYFPWLQQFRELDPAT